MPARPLLHKPPVAPPAPFQLETAQGRRLDGFVDLPRAAGPCPAVVICHGFKGFMEWGFFPYLAALLADRGFVAVRFNFAGSGMRPGEDRATDPEGFEAATPSRDLEDLEAVLAALGDTIAPDRVNRGCVGVFGHSRGGGTAILAAGHPDRSKDGEGSRPAIRSLVTWAAIARFDRWSEADREALRERGYQEIVNGRTGQVLRLGKGYLEDLEAHPETLDVTAAAARVSCPWLLVHGSADEAVPLAEGERLAEAGRIPPPAAELLTLPDAGHTFGARHPFAGPTPDLIQALNATQTRFRRDLG